MKVKIFLSVWFVLLGLIAGTFLSPLHLWKNSVNQILSNEGIQLERLEGRIWQGVLILSGQQLKGPMQLQWHMAEILSPIDFQLMHNDINARGSVKFDLDEMTLWLDYMSLSSGLLNSFLEPYKAKVSESNLVLDKLYGKWPYVESMPNKLRGNGYWDGGNLDYVAANRRNSVFLDKVLFELVNINQVNHLKLMSLTGESYLNASINKQGEAELSVMPASLDLIGQSWSGDKYAPVFVMTDAIF